MNGSLRVGTHGLPEAEAGLVRALVVLLARNSDEFRWVFAAEGPFNALIVGGHAADLSNRALRASARAWASLGVPASAAWPGEVLQRPIDADRLRSWLSGVQEVLEGAATMPMPLEPLTAEAALPAQRYRLRHWPPLVLLRGDRQRVRMATLLSRRPLGVRELAALSGQPEERCLTFVNLLQGFNLLELTATPAAVVRHPAAPRSEQGLLDRLKRKLGL